MAEIEPWKRPKVKRIMQVFNGKVFAIKQSNIVERKVGNEETIQR